MRKLKVQLAKLGNLNTWLDMSKVSNWKSSLFEVLPDVDQHRLPTKAAGFQWDFLDDQVSRALPKKIKGDFLVALTDSPLEGNYYMRRLPGNRVCISFFQVRDILAREDMFVIVGPSPQKSKVLPQKDHPAGIAMEGRKWPTGGKLAHFDILHSLFCARRLPAIFTGKPGRLNTRRHPD